MSDLFVKEKTGFLKIIQNNYKKAPYFQEVYDLLISILDHKDLNISSFIVNSLKQICEYLEIKTPIHISSKLKKNNKLKGQDRVVDICKTFKTTIYINPIGGKMLYSKDIFKKNKMSLYFLQTNDIVYKHNEQSFIPNLSIVDVLMYNSKDEMKKMLMNFELV